RVPHGAREPPGAQRGQERRASVRGEELRVGDPARARARVEVDGDDPDAHGTSEGTTPDLVHAREHPRALAQERSFEAQAGPDGGHQSSGVPAGSGTSANVAPGLRIPDHRFTGQILTNATPTTFATGIEPPPGLPGW